MHDAFYCIDSTLYHTIIGFARRQTLQCETRGEQPAHDTITIVCGTQAHQFVGNSGNDGYQHYARDEVEITNEQSQADEALQDQADPTLADLVMQQADDEQRPEEEDCHSKAQ